MSDPNGNQRKMHSVKVELEKLLKELVEIDESIRIEQEENTTCEERLNNLRQQLPIGNEGQDQTQGNHDDEDESQSENNYNQKVEFLRLAKDENLNVRVNPLRPSTFLVDSADEAVACMNLLRRFKMPRLTFVISNSNAAFHLEEHDDIDLAVRRTPVEMQRLIDDLITRKNNQILEQEKKLLELEQHKTSMQNDTEISNSAVDENKENSCENAPESKTKLSEKEDQENGHSALELKSESETEDIEQPKKKQRKE